MLALGRAAGVVGGAFTALAGITVEAVRSLRRFAEGVNESNRYLANYNGGIARAFAELHVGDIRRNIRMGAMTEQTAVRLANEINRMRDAWMPFDKSMRNMQNVFATMAAEVSGRVGKNLGGFAEIAERIVSDKSFQETAMKRGEQLLRFISPAGGFIWDNLDKLISRINKWLDQMGFAQIQGDAPANLGAWEDFVMAARDGRFGKPANPGPRIGPGGADLGVGQFGPRPFLNPLPGQGPPINPAPPRGGKFRGRNQP